MTFTYTEVGATRTGTLPPGYRHLHVRHRLSRRAHPPEDLAWLGEQLLTWRVHAAARVTLEADAPVAAPGGKVTTLLGVGRLRLFEPCEVVWVERGERRVAFGYGTLPGHAFVGEECFAVERDVAGDLWWTIDVFSRPALWWVRPLALVVPTFQRVFAHHLGRGAAKLLRARAG
ncbi:DUF1990 family protein [Cellulosimicrobium arenosum]|uniref:DUF1990 domain-containing protein n=1 Tax=Cellulosimicrobium arenosum TaxID=2708133 RepID=A0A927PG77_9MICO|nr:DUF1990 domain-containing protein [Cellulosimicrobium arenosum]MBD8080105.1 DUF1990 domain-containing protein [Cellulosimicrobium arenosum]